MRAEELLLRCAHALVAFNGPIAELPVTDPRADRLRVMVDGRLPRKVARTDDPLVVVAYAATIGPATERAVYAQLGRVEYEVVAAAPPAPGVRDALAALAAAGTQVTVVSSLAPTVVRSFLVVHGLADYVRHVSARTGPDRSVLPPAPNLVTRAVHERAMESCVFVGSTGPDLAAARAAGVDTIRYGPAAEPVADPWFGALSAPGKRGELSGLWR
jgi:phosphoglycolate phosphatase-like HAD superfamily hydrolase